MRVLRRTTKDQMDERDPLWRDRPNGASRYWMNWSGTTKLAVHPFTYGTEMTIGILEKPSPMDAEAETEPDERIPTAHHEHLVFAAAAYLYSQDGTRKDLAKADRFMAQFYQLIGGVHVRSKDVPAN